MNKILISLFVLCCVCGQSFSQIDTISYNIYQLDGNLGVGVVPAYPMGGMHIRALNATLRLEDTDELAGDVYQLTNNTKGNDVLNFAIYDKTDERADLSFDGEGNIAVLNGNAGFGTREPSAKVQVADGDVYISDISYGIIMRSPDGNCWKGTVDNYGQLNFVLMELCPEQTTIAIDAPDYSSSAEISIYPNPANKQISLEVDNMNVISLNLRITDHIGREIETMHISRNITSIQVSHLPAGVYYIDIRGQNVYWNEKLIIK